MYSTQSAYIQQSAAYVLKVLSAMTFVIREGEPNPTKVKQQTISYLAQYEVAILRKVHPDYAVANPETGKPETFSRASTRSNNATNLKNLLKDAIKTPQALQAKAVELSQCLDGSRITDYGVEDYEDSYRKAYPKVSRVLEVANDLDGLGLFQTEVLTDKELASLKVQIGRFCEEFRRPLKVDSSTKNTAYKADVKERREAASQRAFKPASLIERAELVLSNLTEYRWEEISCALAISTGRRAVETHLSGSYWMPSDKEWEAFKADWVKRIGADTLPERSSCIAFKGQAKGKSRKVGKTLLKDVVFVFPTLVDPALVLHGLEYLDKKGKRFEPTLPHPTVNQRYGRYLSEEVKRHWSVVAEEKENTYHKLRAAYFCTTTTRMGLENAHFDTAAGLLIGDGDMTTIQSYQRYKISEDTEVTTVQD